MTEKEFRLLRDQVELAKAYLELITILTERARSYAQSARRLALVAGGPTQGLSLASGAIRRALAPLEEATERLERIARRLEATEKACLSGERSTRALWDPDSGAGQECRQEPNGDGP